MGKKAPTMPPTPDYTHAGRQQEHENRRAAYENVRLNQMRQKTPYGEVYYTGDIGSEDRTKHVQLDPALQQQRDMQMQMNQQLVERAGNVLGQMPQNAFSTENLPEMPSDFSEQSGRIEKAHFDRATSLLKPMMADQKRALDVELANKGIPIGSEAYQKATQGLYTNQQDVLSRIAMGAVEAGQQEQSRQFDMARMSRQQGMNERLQARQQPLNELSAYMGNQMQTMQEPQFESLSGRYEQPVNYMPAVQQNYRASLAADSEKQKRRLVEMRGLLGLGKAFMGA